MVYICFVAFTDKTGKKENAVFPLVFAKVKTIEIYSVVYGVFLLSHLEVV